LRADLESNGRGVTTDIFIALSLGFSA